MDHVLHETQYSATGKRNILDAAAALRDVVAASNGNRGGFCLITLDFKSAFNNISHKYLYGALRKYNYGTKITGAIMSLYARASSCVSINGRFTTEFQLRRSIRQGCPLSSILYALVINPLFTLINEHLSGLRIGQRRKVACVAYADDITVIINNERDLQTLTRLITTYEKATGATINWNKTKALPLGHWNTVMPLVGIKFTNEATILGITFGHDIHTTIESTWSQFASGSGR
jgi:hypothetical protein